MSNQSDKNSEVKKPIVISAESAYALLVRLGDYYDIEPDMLDNDQKKNLSQINDRLIGYIRKGRLDIKFTDAGAPSFVQTLKFSKQTIRYSGVSAKAKTEMGSKETTNHNGRIYAMMGALSDVGEDGILELEGVDMSVVETLGAFFMIV